ncbi:DNA primase [Candidatus Sulfotelmatobacter kueseliae]|uniref:DNA primase n=1 Tax=Candidatus Sulfotelmatobacter kueseliae TaxID=2042962 RepID=A0A2U3L9F5_9BACT|nr:DNA primase [Candidatus Sulfotelmatobacter kueseliae]
MANPGDFAYTVKQQADIVRIIGDYIKLKKAGAQNYSGLCPFHGEKTASFSVHATRQFYHCFGCGVSGDVFSFVQKIENITFPEAVRLVAQKLGIPLPKASYATAGEAKEARQRAQLLQAHERAVEFFQDSLRRPEGARAREYLKGRGLDDETIARFHIGYAPDSGFLLRDRLKDEFTEDVLRDSGLFSWKTTEGAPSLSVRPLDGQGGDFDSVSSRAEHQVRDSGVDAQSRDLGSNSGLRTQDSGLRMYSKFRNRVMFPIASEAGKVIAFTGRTLSTDEKAGPKYLNSPETPIYSKSRVLFNLDLAREWIRKFDYAILVEGQMDCISVYAAGFHNVIASSGTAFTELQARLLGRFSKNVVVNFDPDTAGARATERTLGLLVEEEFQIKVLTLEQGFDPDLFIRRKGKDAYGDALRRSQSYFPYLIERARAQFPVRSGEGKHKAVQYLLPHIQRIPSRIVRDELAQEIAQKLGIDSPVLRHELRHVAVTRSAATVKAPAEAQVTDAERILISALTSARQILPGEEHLSTRDGAREVVKDDEFDPARQAAFVLETEGLHRGLATESLAESLLNAGPEVADILEVPATESDRRMLKAILLKENDDLTPDLLDSAVRALRKMALDRRRQEIGRALERPGNLDRSQQIALAQERLKMKLAKRSPDSRVESPSDSTLHKDAAP